ncbi:MAG: prepilin peptidase, partial [Alphaproteobacteria bacterium]|nr:prepilin peptidase [Alphaproteobacteria bacterium]
FLLPTVTAAVMTPFFPRSLGGGDFKMLTALGAWLGFPGLIAVILSSVIFFALIALIRRQKEGPYGTSLFLGVLTVLILQQFDCLRFLFVVV